MLLALTALFGVIILFGAWSSYDKTRKLLCHYQGVDRVVRDYWVKPKDKKVTFDKKEFHILSECVCSKWFRGGIHIIFPIKVDYLHFAWYHRFPLDPNDYKRTWDTPELRDMLNLEQQAKSFVKNFTPSKEKKLSGLSQYMPLIAIGLVILVAFFLFTQQQDMMGVINQMQNQINTITPP